MKFVKYLISLSFLLSLQFAYGQDYNTDTVEYSSVFESTDEKKVDKLKRLSGVSKCFERFSNALQFFDQLETADPSDLVKIGTDLMEVRDEILKLDAQEFLTCLSSISINGRTLGSWEYIYLPNGEFLTVDHFLKNINYYSARIAQYSKGKFDFLTNKDQALGFLQMVLPENLQSRKEDIYDLLYDFDPSKMINLTGELLKQKFLDEIEQEKQRLINEALSDGLSFIPENDMELPNIEELKKSLSVYVERTWGTSFGSPKTMEAKIDSIFILGATSKREDAPDNEELGEEGLVAEAQATGKLTVLNSIEKEVLTARAYARVPDVDKKNRYGVKIMIAGNDFGNYEDEFDTSSLPQLGDETTVPIINVYSEVRMVIGVIPVTARIGAAGDLGFEWKLYFKPISANVEAGPLIRGYAYGELSVDIYVLGLGVGGELTLIDATLGLVGTAGLGFQEGTLEPEAKVAFNVTNDMTLLDGTFYGFLIIPSLSPPEFRKKIKYMIYEFSGVSTGKKVADNISQISRMDGTVLEGDAKAADLEAGVKRTKKLELINHVIEKQLTPDKAAIVDEYKEIEATFIAIKNLEDTVRNKIEREKSNLSIAD